MRLALFTDVHFGPPTRFGGKLRKLCHLARPLLEGIVRQLNEVEHPDIVINLGDVIEDEAREQDQARYREFLAVLGNSRAPVIHVAGNHDQVNLTPEDLASLWSHDGLLHYSRDIAGVHFAVLCSHEQQDTQVTVPDPQVEWLAADLAQTPLPSVVLVHHPLGEMDLTGNRWFEGRSHVCLVSNRSTLREIIESSGNVVAVFNGHAHWHHIDRHRPVPYVTLQSLIENVDDDAPGRAAGAFCIADLANGTLKLSGRGDPQYEIVFPTRAQSDSF